MIENFEIKTLDKLDIYAKYIVEGYLLGLHRSPFHGFSSEFREHKQYNVGDNIRTIDYKVYARTDKLYTKKFDEETNLRCHLVLDVSNSMYYPRDTQQRKIDFSVISIASLIRLFKKQRDAFGLTTFDTDIREQISPKVTEKNKQLIYNTLYEYWNKTSHDAKSNIVGVIHKLAYISKKKSLYILFTDLFDNIHQENFVNEFIQAVQHLVFEKHELIIFHVQYDKTERFFDFEDIPHHIIDLESGADIKLLPSEIKKAYQSFYEKTISELKTKCKMLGVDWIDVDIEQNYEQILKNYLRYRQKWN